MCGYSLSAEALWPPEYPFGAIPDSLQMLRSLPLQLPPHLLSRRRRKLL